MSFNYDHSWWTRVKNILISSDYDYDQCTMVMIRINELELWLWLLNTSYDQWTMSYCD